MIREIREAVTLAEEHGDPATVDLLSRLVQVHEKHEWCLRDMLRKGDGLCGALPLHAYQRDQLRHLA